MPRLIKMASLFFVLFCLSSCSLGESTMGVFAPDSIQTRLDMLNRENEGEIADAYFEQVIEAIQNQNKEDIKSLFSKEALKGAEDIDGRIDYLITLVQGEIESWKADGWSSGDLSDKGITKKDIKSWYKLSTDEDEYLFFLLIYVEDTKYPDNVGLYSLRAIRAEDKETQFTYWQDMQIAGIYKPEDE